MEVALRRERICNHLGYHFFGGVKWHELLNVAELEYLKHFEGSWAFVKDLDRV